MRLPRSIDLSESEDLIYFAAETAIRRLMHRIIGSLYSPDNIDIALLAESAPISNNTHLNQLLALGSELSRQLDQYYEHIPVQPPISVDPVSNERKRRVHPKVSIRPAAHIPALDNLCGPSTDVSRVSHSSPSVLQSTYTTALRAPHAAK